MAGHRASRRACRHCGETPSYPTKLDGVTYCSGTCYRTALAALLASRRRLLPPGEKAPPLDRTPVAMTDAMASGEDLSLLGRARLHERRGPRRPPREPEPAPALPWPVRPVVVVRAPRPLLCHRCREDVPAEPPANEAGELFCSRTCLLRAADGW